MPDTNIYFLLEHLVGVKIPQNWKIFNHGSLLENTTCINVPSCERVGVSMVHVFEGTRIAERNQRGDVKVSEACFLSVQFGAGNRPLLRPMRRSVLRHVVVLCKLHVGFQCLPNGACSQAVLSLYCVQVQIKRCLQLVDRILARIVWLSCLNEHF